MILTYVLKVDRKNFFKNFKSFGPQLKKWGIKVINNGQKLKFPQNIFK